jgi:hypothetical protein
MADDWGATYVPHLLPRLRAGVGFGLLAGAALSALMFGDDWANYRPMATSTEGE